MQKRRVNKEGSQSERIISRIFAMSKDIRYVAMYRNGKLVSVSKPDLAGASSSESDKYEEIIVNPTLVKLLQQRGDIDCGGIRHVIIHYGNFTQFVHPIEQGHISVAFERDRNYARHIPRIKKLLRDENLILE